MECEIMNVSEIISRLKEGLGDKIVKIETPIDRRVFLTVKEEDLEDAMKAVFDLSRETRFMTLSAVDEGLDIELLYHVDIKGIVVTVRVKVPKEEMEVLDISHIAPAAEFIEREIRDLFGLEFIGLKPEKLVAPKGYEEKPLRKPMVGILPPQARPIAEMLMETACSAPISKAMIRKREDLGLPGMPPIATASSETIKEIRGIAEDMGFTERVGYDIEKKKLRYK